MVRSAAGGGLVEPQPGARPPCATERREKASIPRTVSSLSSSLAVADMYTPCPVPIGARESKTTIPTSGRTAMLREWVTSGADELHGRPVASALASMMSEVVEFTA